MRRRSVFVAAAVSALAISACASNAQPSPGSSGTTTAVDASQVTIYSGRNEKLVGPLLAKIEAATGVKVSVRYAGTPELAGQLVEEGANSPADLFFSQDAGALGELSKAGLLAPVPAETLNKVDGAYRDPKGNWVATSGRIRVLAVNPSVSPQAESYKKIDEILVDDNKGKIGYAPTNASFQAFVTALRVAKGDAGAEEWLTKFKALEPKTYEKNTAVLEAVDSGEVGIGLINHYYWYKLQAEKGDTVKAKLVYLDQTDPGSLLNVAGIGLLKSSKNSEAATKVANYLLSEEAQTYFAEQTAEYPVIKGITSKFQLKPIDASKPHGVDLNELDSLKTTQEMLKKVGLI